MSPAAQRWAVLYLALAAACVRLDAASLLQVLHALLVLPGPASQRLAWLKGDVSSISRDPGDKSSNLMTPVEVLRALVRLLLAYIRVEAGLLETCGVVAAARELPETPGGATVVATSA